MQKNLHVYLVIKTYFFNPKIIRARVPLGLPVSKKQTAILIHLEYKVLLPNHDFAFGESHKLIPSGYSGPTYIYQLEVASMVSCAASHTEEFEKLPSLQDKKKCTNREPASHTPRLCFGQ